MTVESQMPELEGTLSNMKGNFLISLVTAKTTYTTIDVV